MTTILAVNVKGGNIQILISMEIKLFFMIVFMVQYVPRVLHGRLCKQHQDFGEQIQTQVCFIGVQSLIIV